MDLLHRCAPLPFPHFGFRGPPPHPHSGELQVLAPGRCTPIPSLQTGRGAGGLGRTGLYTRQPLSRVVGRARPGCSFVLVSRPGLMEIRAVALSTVAIKGERSVLFLCMDADGKMQGLVGVSVRLDAPGRGPAGLRARGARRATFSFLVCSVRAGVELGGEGGERRITLRSHFLISKFMENG